MKHKRLDNGEELTEISPSQFVRHPLADLNSAISPHPSINLPFESL
jgi:hypothetical protein